MALWFESQSKNQALKNQLSASRLISHPVGIASKSYLDDLGINRFLCHSVFGPFKTLSGRCRFVSHPVGLASKRYLGELGIKTFLYHSVFGAFTTLFGRLGDTSVLYHSVFGPLNSPSGRCRFLSHPVGLASQRYLDFWCQSVPSNLHCFAHVFSPPQMHQKSGTTHAVVKGKNNEKSSEMVLKRITSL